MRSDSPIPAAFCLRGGRVVDGSGRPEVAADIVVRGGRIELHEAGETTGLEIVDVDGAVVAPGFIDAHSHADLEALLDPPAPEVHRSRLLQGVTTEVTGNCGFSPFPVPPERAEDVRRFLGFVFGTAAETFPDLDHYERAVTAAGLASNVAPLVGHGTLRIAEVGYEDRDMTSDEVDHVAAALDRVLAEGAVGLSTGLCYTPATFAPPSEVEALAAVVAARDRVYATHIRNETEGVLGALDEALAVARASGVRLHISHLKAAGRRMHGSVPDILRRLDEARAGGVDVTADAYPYTAASTMLHSLLPPWLIDEGIDSMLVRLADPGVRRKVATDLEQGIAAWQNLGAAAGWDRVTVASSLRNPSRHGRSIVELSVSDDLDPVDTIARVLIEEAGRVVVVIEAMDDDDVGAVLAWPSTVVGSDGIPLPGTPHPRLTGTFPRAFRRYVDSGTSIEEAVRRMTGATAARFGLGDRGMLRDGSVADLVVFDPAGLMDRGTYADPWPPPVGMIHVLVGGRPGVWAGEAVDPAAGIVIRSG
ncbi:MAG TPA: amidohydrolase family protein [Acidimicrobiia bacterium]|nr:amidohydrolase family protein [Acidimicrobiia bacterium]